MDDTKRKFLKVVQDKKFLEMKEKKNRKGIIPYELMHHIQLGCTDSLEVPPEIYKVYY